MARGVWSIQFLFFFVAVLTLHARSEVLAAAADGSAGAAQVAETWTFAGMTVTVATDGTWRAWAIAQLLVAAITTSGNALASWLVHFLHDRKRSSGFWGHLFDELGQKAGGAFISFVSHKVASFVFERLAFSAYNAWLMGLFVALGVLLMYTDRHRSRGGPQGGGTPTVNNAGAAAHVSIDVPANTETPDPETPAGTEDPLMTLLGDYEPDADECRAQVAKVARDFENARRLMEARNQEDSIV
jgi:hypothetical protein